MRIQQLAPRMTVAAVLAFTGMAWAAGETSGGAVGEVDSFYGAFGTSVPIELPAYHGIEPQLGLSYTSTAGDGLAGVGWRLGGLSTIEVLSAGRGAPFVRNAAAVAGCDNETSRAPVAAPTLSAGSGIPLQYALDGMELMPCTTFGGTHCTRIQNYQRIEFDPGNDQWRVWSSDGVQSLYTKVSATRWALRTVTDTHGNRVTYHYRERNGALYPDHVSYNNDKVVVRFHTEPRPDPVRRGTGSRVEQLCRRLSAVEVTVAGEVARAYALNYDASTSTQRSLLSSVTQYGRDAVVHDGQVVSGSGLPPMSMTYHQRPGSTNLHDAGSEVPLYLSPQQTVLFPDLDGDGKADYLYWDDSHYPNKALLRTKVCSSCGELGYMRSARSGYVGDFNGDGLHDLLFVHDDLTTTVMLSHGDGTIGEGDWDSDFVGVTGTPGPTLEFEHWSEPNQLIVADFDGDGADDLLELQREDQRSLRACGDGQARLTYPSRIHLSRRDGRFEAPIEGPAPCITLFFWAPRSVRVGDVNGDGRADIMVLASPNYHSSAYAELQVERPLLVYLSRGNGQFSDPIPGPVLNFQNVGEQARLDMVDLADVNGDGNADLVLLRTAWSQQPAEVYLSQGNGHFASRSSGPTAAEGGPNRREGWRFGDFNGDGTVDFAELKPGGKMVLHLQRPDASSWTADGPPVPTTPSGVNYLVNMSRVRTPELNGDGKTDFLVLPLTLSRHTVYRSEQSHVDLLRTIDNGLGAQTELDYRGSLRLSASETYMPVGAQVSVVTQADTTVRTGQGELTQHSVSYSYEGALWSDAERRFLGFRKVTARVDGDPLRSEVYFHQKNGSISKPEISYLKEADGRVRSYSKNEYTENSHPPYNSLLTRRWDYECNPDTAGGACRQALVELEYDAYANITRINDFGDLSVTGDELTTRRGYFPNRSSYLVGLPAWENRYQAFCDDGRPSVPTRPGLGSVGGSESSAPTRAPRKAAARIASFAHVTAKRVDTAPVASVSPVATPARKGKALPSTPAPVFELPADNAPKLTKNDLCLLEQTRYLYDHHDSYNQQPVIGDLTETQQWNDQDGSFISTGRSYDNYGNVSSERDARGATTTVTYDSELHIFEHRRCNALNHCTTTIWDPVIEQVDLATDINGLTTDYDYDTFGRPVDVEHPADPSCVVALGEPCAVTHTTFEWEFLPGQGARSRETQPDGTATGLWTETYQDGLGRVYRTVRDGNYARDLKYDGLSSREQFESNWYELDVESPIFTYYKYDEQGRLKQVRQADGTKTVRNYGNYGTVTITDWRNTSTEPFRFSRAHSRMHDAHGRLTEINEYYSEQGQPQQVLRTSYRYDVRGQLIGISDHDGNEWTFDYDSLGRQLQACSPDSGCWQYTYDDDGSLARQTDARGVATAFSYDTLGRPVHKLYADGSYVQWRYDEQQPGFSNKGRLTSVTDPNATERHFWNGYGLEARTTFCVTEQCETFSRAYDPNGRISAIAYPDGEVVYYDYASDGTLTSVGSSEASYADDMQWTPNGQLRRLRHHNGVVAEFTYDDSGRGLLKTASFKDGSRILYDAAYEYNGAGEIDSVTSTTNDSLEFDYDNLGRLVGVSGDQSHSFTYDAIGNMLSNSGRGTYYYEDASHPHAVTRIAGVGGGGFSYDANGNMVTAPTGSYTWDVANRLRQVVNDSGVTQFAYNYEGRRVLTVTGGVETRFFGRLAERVGDTLRQYYYAGPVRIARKEVQATGATSRQWYHQDHLGSVRSITDDDANVIARYDYAPFGAVAGDGDPIEDDYGFAGHRGEPGAALIYMESRYYDPALGRFISADSLLPDVTNPQALNPYSYVLNNPISNVDPTGHSPVSSVILGFIALPLAPNAPWLAFVWLAGSAATMYGDTSDNGLAKVIGSTLLGFQKAYALGKGDVGARLLSAAQSTLLGKGSPLPSGAKSAVTWSLTGAGWFNAAKNRLEGGSQGKGTAPAKKQSDKLASSGKADPDQAKVASWSKKLVKRNLDKDMASLVSGFARVKRFFVTRPTPRAPRHHDFFARPSSVLYSDPGGQTSGLPAWLAYFVQPVRAHTNTAHEVAPDGNGYRYNVYGRGGRYAAYPHAGRSASDPLAGQLLGVLFQYGALDANVEGR